LGHVLATELTVELHHSGTLFVGSAR